MFSDGEWLLISHNTYKPIVYFNCLGSNFNGLQSVYGEDVLSKIKGCEFHFKDSINRRVRILHKKGQKFKELATELLYAMIPERYKNAEKNVEVFIENEKYTNFLDGLSGGMIDGILFSTHLNVMRIQEATRLKWYMQVGFISFIYLFELFEFIYFFTKFYKNQIKLGSFTFTSVLFQKRRLVFLWLVSLLYLWLNLLIFELPVRF